MVKAQLLPRHLLQHLISGGFRKAEAYLSKVYHLFETLPQCVPRPAIALSQDTNLHLPHFHRRELQADHQLVEDQGGQSNRPVALVHQ